MTAAGGGRGWSRRALAVGGTAAVLSLGALGTGGVSPTAAAETPLPSFVNYQAPSHFYDPAVGQCSSSPTACLLTGEPTMGVNPKTKKAFYQAWIRTARITFDASRPARATWEDVSSVETNQGSLDTIIYTDPITGRTFVDQLTGACSIMVYTDDDGNTWTPSTHPCEAPPGADHQTIGSGPFVPPLTSPVYPNAVYYCSQDVAASFCSTSLDGGLNFGPGEPLFTAATCFGLHGHIRTGPDGTAYVPDKACSTDPVNAPWCMIVTPPSDPHCHRAVVVSPDNGVSWSVHVIPDSGVKDSGNSDPSVAVGAKNTVYVGYENRDGHAMAAVSRDHGQTFLPSVDVGKQLGVERSQFAAVIAGDDDRAAYAFLGSTTPGEDQTPAYTGIWYLYISMTYDGGKTWTTVNATPNDPVQRGCFQQNGGGCPDRNLLDFNDIVMDQDGRVLAPYTDGCVGDCETNPKNKTKSRVPAFVRQSCGRGLLAAHDPGFSEFCVTAQPAAAATATAGPTPAPPVAPVVPNPPSGGGVPNTSGRRANGLVVGLGVPLALGILTVTLAGVRRRRATSVG